MKVIGAVDSAEEKQLSVVFREEASERCAANWKLNTKRAIGAVDSAEEKQLSVVFREEASERCAANWKLNTKRAIGAVGSASERHSEGHWFESNIAHHKGQITFDLSIYFKTKKRMTF